MGAVRGFVIAVFFEASVYCFALEHLSCDVAPLSPSLLSTSYQVAILY